MKIVLHILSSFRRILLRSYRQRSTVPCHLPQITEYSLWQNIIILFYLLKLTTFLIMSVQNRPTGHNNFVPIRSNLTGSAAERELLLFKEFTCNFSQANCLWHPLNIQETDHLKGFIAHWSFLELLRRQIRRKKREFRWWNSRVRVQLHLRPTDRNILHLHCHAVSPLNQAYLQCKSPSGTCQFG